MVTMDSPSFIMDIPGDQDKLRGVCVCVCVLLIVYCAYMWVSHVHIFTCPQQYCTALTSTAQSLCLLN